MMKKFGNVVACVMIALMVLSACGPREVGPRIDKNKTQIYISLYSGGYGTDWLVEWLDEYNKTLEKYQFIKLGHNLDENATLTAKIVKGLSDADIYIAPSSDIWELKHSGMLMDLTNIYENPAPGETRPIKDKIPDYEMYKKAYSDGKGIYALPYTTSPIGFVYDHDLFEQEGFLFKDGDNLTLGTDGLPNTFDDGLPVTMEEFDILLNNILNKEYYPFIYAQGSWGSLGASLAENIWAAYEGKESYELSYLYEGTYTSKDGTTTKVTPETGYKVYTEKLMDGRIKAIEFGSDYFLNQKYFLKDDKLDPDAANGKFVLSHNEKRIAMMVNGYWWENESKKYFDADEAKSRDPNLGFKKRDFRFLPLPVYKDSAIYGENKTYLVSGGEGSLFALKQTDPGKQAAIEEFIRLYCSDARLQAFTVSSSAMLPFDYKLTPEQAKTLSPFARNMAEILSSPNTVLFKPNLMDMANPFKYSLHEPHRFKINVKTFSCLGIMSITKNIHDGRFSAGDYKNAFSNLYNAESWKKVYGAI